MPEIDVNDIANIGSIRDVPSYMLPPEVWTLALNMRAVDGGMETIKGWAQVFPINPVAPHFAMPLSTPAQTFWLYVSLTKGYVWDGSTHTEITRPSGDYSAGDTKNWNGTLLGGVPILNNDGDIPQYWPVASIAQKLGNLPNWPSTMRAKIIRAFGPYLVAFHITKGVQVFPHLVTWSHPAVPGSVPSSWDAADPTVDAGEKDLEDVESGVIVDAGRLGELMMIYKGTSTWRQRIIGGRFIFDFKPAFEGVGILGPRCFTTVNRNKTPWHIVATQDDIIIHNGVTFDSILDRRQRRRLQNELDTVNFANSFIVHNPIYREIWFCYPSQGQIQPDKALVINYSETAFVITEMDGITFRNAASGPIEAATSGTWNDAVGTWEDETDPWSSLQRRRVVCCGVDSSKFMILDEGVTRDGVAFLSKLSREALALTGQKKNGQAIVDFQPLKLVDRFWPKITGGPIEIRVGTQELVDGPILWRPAVPYDPSLSPFADIGDPVSGRAISTDMASSAAFGHPHWRIDGYKINVNLLGNF